ncbi:MAG: glycosyltransferase, partial [Candidatus Binatia bacterium]
QAHPKSPFSDQDALNVACDGLWTRLDPRWNFLDCYESKKLSQLSAEGRPGIVHFVTYDKPWNAGFLNVNAEF